MSSTSGTIPDWRPGTAGPDGSPRQFNRTTVDAPAERNRILRELLAEFGEDSEVRPPFHCDYGSQIRIGARTFVNFGLVALDPAPISIGE